MKFYGYFIDYNTDPPKVGITTCGTTLFSFPLSDEQQIIELIGAMNAAEARDVREQIRLERAQPEDFQDTTERLHRFDVEPFLKAKISTV